MANIISTALALDVLLMSKDLEVLRKANEGIVARIKNLRTIASLEAISSIQVGDKVQYDSNKLGRKVSGIVQRIKTKKVEVKLDSDNRIWVVPACMLEKV